MQKNRNTHSKKDIDTMVDPIAQNIESLVNLHVSMEKKVNRHQRTLESITAELGRPRMLYSILALVVVWMCVNIALPHLRLIAFDAAPFPWLQDIISLSALLMTVVVLITQNRQDKMTEQRRQLDLQVNLVVEQKVTKLIQLVEELRKDMPIVANRHDPEAEAMKVPVDPHEVLTTFNQMLEESTQRAE